jgi:hypothetical protein
VYFSVFASYADTKAEIMDSVSNPDVSPVTLIVIAFSSLLCVFSVTVQIRTVTPQAHWKSASLMGLAV